MGIRTSVWVGMMVAAMVGGRVWGHDAVVREVRVTGARQVAEERVRAWLVARPGSRASDAALLDDARRIVEGYRSAGHWHARVTAPRWVAVPGGVAAIYEIDEGPLTRVGRVLFDGAAALDTTVLADAMRLRPGAPLVPAVVAQDVEGLLDLYENNGFPYAAIMPRASVGPDSAVTDLAIAIDEGPHITVDEVRILGSRHTREKVLLREAGLRTAAPFDAREVARAARALRRLPFLRRVGEPRLEVDARTGRHVVAIEVEDGRASWFEGLAGIVPRSQAGGGHSLTGALLVSSDNVMGTGRQARLKWERPGPGSADLDLFYREPWVGGLPLWAGAGVRMTSRMDFEESRVEGHVGARPGRVVEVEATFGASRVSPLGAPAEAGRHRAWEAGAEVRTDSRDDRQNPSRGGRLSGRAAFARVTAGDGRIRRFLVEGAADRALPVGRWTVLAVHIRAASVRQEGGVTPEAVLRLGGTETIRGYEEEQFLATDGAWGGVELRRLVGPGARVFAFVDGGILSPSGEGTGPVRALGYGIGLRAPTRAGTLGLDYGLARGDAPSEGKVHVRMAKAF